MESQKPGAIQRLRGAMELKIYSAILIVTAQVKCSYGPLRRRLERAAQTPSRRAH